MSQYMPKWDVWITQTKMPIRVRAFCKQVDGMNCIVLNSDLSDRRKREAIKHELEHIQKNDLNKDGLVVEIEKEIGAGAFLGRRALR